ncbi:MAG: hypothetical protein LBU32_20720 [Clostridiales bacterium]|nr:hypothetical protein [Clostridiales bacterium]
MLGHWEIGSDAGKKSDKAAVPAIAEATALRQIAAELGDRGRLQKRSLFRHSRSSFEKGVGERYIGLPRRFAEKGRNACGMLAPLYAKAAD